MKLTREPAVEAQEQERVQRVEHAAPATTPGERRLREGQERKDDREPLDSPVRMPREERGNQEQQGDRLGDEESESAVRVERLRVVELVHLLDPEDPLARQKDLDHDQYDHQRREPLQERRSNTPYSVH